VSERVSRLLANVSDEIEVKQLLQTGNTLLEADRVEDASRLLDIAVSTDVSSESQETLALFSGLLVNVGRYNDARRILDESDSRFAPSAISWFQQGLCKQTSGEFEDAARCHRNALKCEANFGRAAYSLAINGRSAVTSREVEEWQAQACNGNNNVDEKIQFLFATARTLDGQGEIGSSFTHYQTANELHHTRDPFDADRWDAYIDSVIENFSENYFDKTKQLRRADTGAGLVFIIGMPRSGSTLLEYQLSRQFGATALGEHPTIRRLFMDLPHITNENRPVPQCAEYIAAEHIEYMRNQYLESVTRYKESALAAGQNTGDTNDTGYDTKGLVVDKMLGNFLRLGILATMFPEAKILHCSRTAEATCVSCYTNLFARGLKFTYDLNGLGRAWRSYQRLMNHWREVLPLTIYDVPYEHVVTQPSDVFSELSEYIGRTANTTETNSDTDAINTASFYQARQPISTKSVDGWKRFESYLDPLMQGLGK